MMRDITIGQYYQTDSVLHKLDPRVKLFATLIYMISLFMTNSIIGFAYSFICLAVVIFVSKIPVSFMMRGLKGIIILLMFSSIFNMFYTDGHVVCRIWVWKITYEGIWHAIYISIRLILLIIGASLLTLTTTPNSLTDGLEKALHFLNKIKIPVAEIAMMMSITLRFIPILMEETDKIIKAQVSRGANFSDGNIFKKAKNMIPLLVPLFVSAFKRANDLAIAMDARCYNGGNGRTKMNPLKYCRRDIISYITILCYFCIMIIIKINGGI